MKTYHISQYIAIGAILLMAIVHSSFFYVRQNTITTNPYSEIDCGELFIDSTRIGIKNRHKLEVRKCIDDSVYVEINLYKKQNDAWIPQQQGKYTCTLPPNLNVEIIDYNNDGFSDFSYESNMAARSANEIRTLFIYNPETEKFQHIRNSEHYPNPAYNSKLDCIDSYAIYGGSTTYFLKVQADSLYRFASVSLFDTEREILVYNQQGEETILLQDTLGNRDLVYIRFTDYNLESVLEEYEEVTSEGE